MKWSNGGGKKGEMTEKQRGRERERERERERGVTIFEHDCRIPTRNIG